MAIIADDTSRVAHVINRWPNAIREENINTQTPLHFAASKPHMLSIILPTADVSMLNKQDYGGYSPLDYAWMMSRDLCGNSFTNSVGHLNCHCLGSFDLILEAALKTPQHVLRSDKISQLWDGVDTPCKEKAMENYAKYIRECCDSLRIETTQALMDIGLKPSTMELTPLPGRHETELLATMKEFDTRNPSLIDRWKFFQSLYTWIKGKIIMAEALFQQGFTQVDAFVDGGLPPLAATWDLCYAEWLIDHGADPNRRLYEMSASAGADTAYGVVSSHYAAFHLGNNLGIRDESHARNHFPSLLSPEVRDRCSCACSNTGCSQFVYFLKAIFSWHSHADCYKIGKRMAGIGSLISDQYHLTATRFLTFEQLGITHTCCNAREFCYNEDPWKSFEGDIEGIQEEERTMLCKLDLLREEFENEFRRTFLAEPIAPLLASTSMSTVGLEAHESDAHSESNDSWETAGSEDESEHEVVDPYYRFWVDHWGERMREVLEEMDAVKMSAEEKRVTEDIGVVWDDDTFVSSEVL
ncbi:hypothetical protein PG987_001912 [Apiospora arundinis]